MTIRLNQTEKDPQLALTHGWYRDPEFLEGLFDRCEHLGYYRRKEALELAKHAVKFAESHGDPHLVNRAHGVLSFTCIGKLGHLLGRQGARGGASAGAGLLPAVSQRLPVPGGGRPGGGAAGRGDVAGARGVDRGGGRPAEP